MSTINAFSLAVGSDAARRDIAVEQRPGTGPGLFWLGGFRSDMTGSKAMALDGLGAQKGLCVTRFDYSGHGASGGALRCSISGEPAIWSKQAGQNSTPAGSANGFVVPWLEGASPTTSSVRVSSPR